MTIVWTTRARRQLLAIVDSLLEENLQAATQVAAVIEQSVERLATFPDLGRRGRG